MTDQSNLPAQTRAPKPTLAAGASLNAIIPTTIEETFRLADAVHRSGLAPSTLKTVEAITIAVMTGMEVGLKPMQALSSIAVINGRATIWGDGLIAIVRDSPLCQWVQEEIFGEGLEMFALCTTHRRGEPQPVVRRFSAADAKRAGLWGKTGPWTQYPQRMLQMRARAWCLRDVYPDVTKGMQVREEVEDYDMRDVTPHSRQSQGTGFVASLKGGTGGAGFSATRQLEQLPSHDPETGEIIEQQESPRKAAEAGSESAGMQVEASASAEAGIAGQPAETPAATGGTSGANVSGDDHAQGVTAGETAAHSDPDASASLDLVSDTPSSGADAAGGESEAVGADSPSASGLADLLDAYAKFLWRTPTVEKLEAKAKEFWAEHEGSKPGSKSPMAGLFREVMEAHKNRVSAGSAETKELLDQIVERGRVA